MKSALFPIVLVAAFLATSGLAGAQAPGGASNATGSVTGTVVDGNGTPVANAIVSVEGARGQARTGSDGTFAVSGITPGNYAVVVSRSGFDTARVAGIAVVGGAPTNLRVTLAQSSFSSLRVIGQTSTTASGRSQINTTPSSVAVITSQVFEDRGEPQIVDVLNQTPGIITTHIEANGASEGTQQAVMIRGGLPYETESLIDGHPLSIGASGEYNPILLNPGVLQEVEVVKGPGSFGTEINSAINGTVNYITLQPTRTPQQSFDIGSDQYGGITTTLRATGSIPSHFVDYAFAYSTNGTTGPLHNFEVPSSTTTFDYLGATPYSINGQQIAGPTTSFVPANTPQYAGYPGEIRLSQPLYFCCSALNTAFHQDSELAKIRLNLSQQTALTLSFLGGQAEYDSNATGLAAFTGLGIQFFDFIPPAGYTGSVGAGANPVFDDNAGLISTTSSQTGLYQAELRTGIGQYTVLARLYSSYETDLSVSPGESTLGLQAWGGVPLCPVGDVATAAGGCNLPSGAAGPAPTMTFFNGQKVTIGGTGGDPNLQVNQDHSHGYSLEIDRPVGDNTYSVSFDRSNHDSTEFLDAPLDVIDSYQLSPGSGQQFTTIKGEAQVAVAKNVSVTLGEYLIDYASHYTGDGGLTFSDSSHHYDAPRLAVLARPNADTSLRFSMGASIAPPYISLLSAPGGSPVPNIPGAPTYYTENVNNGNISPETAFGYDLGIDRRLASRVAFTADVYMTDLRNLFLDETYQNGTYTATGGGAVGQTAPLYITETANLGHARYEGIEAAIVSDPLVGFGYRIQGSLMRAFAYDIPNSLYATTSGPYTTNLAVVPNINFQPTGIGFNGVEDIAAGAGRVPYSQGYAEISYRTKHGAYANLGVTYYGSNNSYNNPAFGVVSSTIRVPVSKSSSIQLSIFNLTNAYAQPYFNFFGGIPVPLVNGSHGISTGNLGIIESGNVGPATLRLSFHTALGR